MPDQAEHEKRDPRVVVFAPAPLLTTTIEAGPRGDEVHVHPGGQGVWQARMLAALGARVTICAAFGGETGEIARLLLERDGFAVVGVDREDSNPAYVHDRRGGDRSTLVETDDPPLTRHELDELYALTLRESLSASVVLLSGPVGDGVLDPDTYHRFAADLGALDCAVVVDLAGERLTAALAGGVDLVKVSHEELRRDGRIEHDDERSIVAAMRRLRDEGARTVAVTRADEGVLALIDDQVLRFTAPELQVVDTKGAGDSLTAATAAMLARDPDDVRGAIAVGTAAGALNVTRHGLGSGEASAIRAFASRVMIDEREG